MKLKKVKMKLPEEGSASYSTQVDWRASSRDLKQAPGNMFPAALLATMCIYDKVVYTKYSKYNLA
jgi:hypothetical protein